MTADELKKELHAARIGKTLFGSNNMVFDPAVGIVSSGNLKLALDWARGELSWFEYSTRSDCNKYHLMLCGRINEWLLRNTEKSLPDAVGMLWGYYNGENHFWCYAMTENGLVHINYGETATPENYRGIGSFTA